MIYNQIILHCGQPKWYIMLLKEQKHHLFLLKAINTDQCFDNISLYCDTSEQYTDIVSLQLYQAYMIDKAIKTTQVTNVYLFNVVCISSSHWERRTLNNEVMNGFLSRYSVISIKHDSNWCQATIKIM